MSTCYRAAKREMWQNVRFLRNYVLFMGPTSSDGKKRPSNGGHCGAKKRQQSASSGQTIDIAVSIDNN